MKLLLTLWYWSRWPLLVLAVLLFVPLGDKLGPPIDKNFETTAKQLQIK